MKTRIAGIVPESITDGPGIRVTLFFQGCEHHCPGCHNPQTWDVEGGTLYEMPDLLKKFEDMPLVQGITLSGGEPFLQAAAACEVARFFKSRQKDVWTYTGYLWEQLIKSSDPVVHELLDLSDVLVDGPFILAQRRLDLYFRGSANQRLISSHASLKNKQIILWEPDSQG